MVRLTGVLGILAILLFAYLAGMPSAIERYSSD
jgi:hypothetical protein